MCTHFAVEAPRPHSIWTTAVDNYRLLAPASSANVSTPSLGVPPVHRHSERRRLHTLKPQQRVGRKAVVLSDDTIVERLWRVEACFICVP